MAKKMQSATPSKVNLTKFISGPDTSSIFLKNSDTMTKNVCLVDCQFIHTIESQLDEIYFRSRHIIEFFLHWSKVLRMKWRDSSPAAWALLPLAITPSGLRRYGPMFSSPFLHSANRNRRVGSLFQKESESSICHNVMKLSSRLPLLLFNSFKWLFFILFFVVLTVASNDDGIKMTVHRGPVVIIG